VLTMGSRLMLLPSLDGMRTDSTSLSIKRLAGPTAHR
jgi:hypothetical protein